MHLFWKTSTGFTNLPRGPKHKTGLTSSEYVRQTPWGQEDSSRTFWRSGTGEAQHSPTQPHPRGFALGLAASRGHGALPGLPRALGHSASGPEAVLWLCTRWPEAWLPGVLSEAAPVGTWREGLAPRPSPDAQWAEAWSHKLASHLSLTELPGP